MPNKPKQPTAEESAEARNKGEEGRVENKSVINDPIADFTEAMRGIMDREEEEAAAVKAAGEAAPEEIAQRTGAEVAPEEKAELAAVGQKVEDLVKDTEAVLGNVQAAVRGEFGMKKRTGQEEKSFTEMEEKWFKEGELEVVTESSFDVIPAHRILPVAEEMGNQRPVSGEIEAKKVKEPEIKEEPKVVAEGAEEVIELTEKDRKKPKPPETPKLPEDASAVSSPSEGEARRGLDARTIELKILDLEEEKERIEAMDLSQQVAKVAELTPAEKKAYKKMLKTGKLEEPPKGTPESEAAGAELNRIFQRIPQVNKELADLRRQLKRAQLGGGETPPLNKGRRGGVEEPAEGARGGQMAPEEAKSAEEIEHQNLRVKEQEGGLTEEEFEKLLSLDFKEHLRDNPPLDEIFSPEFELSEIKKLPRKEKIKALVGFKEKLAGQREGWAACRVFIERSIEFDNNMSADRLIEKIDQFAEKYSFSPYQREMLKKFIEDYHQNRAKALDIRQRFPDNTDLVKYLTGLKFSDKDLEVSVGPMTIDITTSASIAKKIHQKMGGPTGGILTKFGSGGFATRSKHDDPIFFIVLNKDAFTKGYDAPTGEAVRKHEYEHHKNSILQKIFESQLKGGVLDLSGYERESDPEIKKTILGEIFRNERDIALWQAKDEIIAMLQNRSVSVVQADLVYYFFSGNVGAYDYLKSARNYKPAKKDALYQKMAQEMLVKEYRLIIQKAVDSYARLVEKGGYSRGKAVALLTDKSLQEWPINVRRLLDAKQTGARPKPPEAPTEQVKPKEVAGETSAAKNRMNFLEAIISSRPDLKPLFEELAVAKNDNNQDKIIEIADKITDLGTKEKEEAGAHSSTKLKMKGFRDFTIKYFENGRVSISYAAEKAPSPPEPPANLPIAEEKPADQK